MKWSDIREHYPEQWLLVEAMQAHTESGKRILDEMAVISPFPDSYMAIKKYMELHRNAPEREFYVLHSSREKLEITERIWLGIRGAR